MVDSDRTVTRARRAGSTARRRRPPPGRPTARKGRARPAKGRAPSSISEAPVRPPTPLPAIERAAGEPTIAAVICTRDRPEALWITLESILGQSRRPDELVIVDDGALSAEWADRIDAACRGAGQPWQLHRTGCIGLTRARNRAAARVDCDVLLYLDDDVTCAPDCVAEIARLMTDRRIAAVTSSIEEPAFESPSGRLYQLGYRFAGWWAVRPRCRPRGPAPAALRDRSIARPARWLSGAAMALRREVLLRHPFDEALADYALGEDREMGYRLAPDYWLVEAVRARVVHRREAGGRGDARRFGFMTAHNYLCILRRTCRMDAGDWLVAAWGLIVLAVMHMAWSVVGDRRAHRAQLAGMFWGVIAALAGREPACRDGAPPGRAAVGAPRADDDNERRAARTGHVVEHAGRVEPPVRVLFVTNRLEPGGAEQMLLTLARRLPAECVQPVVACLQDGGPWAEACRAAGVPVHAGLLKHKYDFGAIGRLHRLIAEHGIDAVVAAHSGGDRMFWTTLAGRARGVPVLVWSHWHPTSDRPHFEHANRALYRWVDAYIALGEAHRRALHRQAHVPLGRIHVVHNGIEPGPFLAASRAEARRRLGLTRGQLAVAFVANLRPEKRAGVFIEAAARLAPRWPAARFLLIGDGPQRDSVRRAVSDAVAGRSVPAESLRLLGPRSDVPQLLAGIDIVVLCSEIECFSIVMLEAGASGCCFIGPRVGSMGEFLDDGVTGLVIRPADVKSLTDAIERAAADAPLRARLGEAARRAVLSGFTAERMAREFAALARSVVAARSQ